MDDDWSDEDVVEEPKEDLDLSQQENHIEQSPMLPPHLLESAALGRMSDKPEETIIVSKNERFADVTYDRRDSRSPDQNIHGQRQIYNPKLGRFEMVENQAGRETERQSRRNVEIMQRGPPTRRGSSAGRRRDSLAKPDDIRPGRGYQENRGYSPSTQRRPSFVDRDPLHRRRDSFISTSGVSDADRSMSNASPGIESQPTSETAPIDLIALQAEKMAESRKRAQERRAEDEKARLAITERARKKAEQLALMASAEKKSDTSKASPTTSTASPVPPKVSPVPQKVSPLPPRASPLPPRASPLVPKASPATAVAEPATTTAENQSKPSLARADSALWTTNREQEEIIRNESPSKEESQQKRSAWGAIGPQKSPTHTKHHQNGLFGNPNTLAALNNTIGGDTSRRGRNAPRPVRAPITPTNVPPSLQGWAAFAGSVETRKAHDDERQQERNQEREKMERERSANGQKSTSLVDKWKRVEIKEPETVGDVAGRTVVSVLKSGYVEDLSGNLEVRDLSVQKSRSEPGSTTPGMSSVLPESKSPVLGSATQSLGMQTPTQSTLDKTPGSRDRSRFFPSPSSTVVDMSPRVVHPIQPSQPDKSVFPQSLFSSFEDLAKSPASSTPAMSPLPGTSVPPFSSNSQGPQRQHMPPFAQLGQGITSPGQALAAAPHIGGLTPRSAFSHTLPANSPPLPPTYKTKLPSVEDFETVLARLRQTIQTSQQQPPPNEDIPPFTPLDSLDSQVQTRTSSIPNDTDMQTYMKISAISPNRDLQISTRDLDDEPLPKPTVKVSLPKILYTSTRDMDLPMDTASSRPTIKLPSQVVSRNDTPDVKSRLIAIDHDFPPQSHHRGGYHNPRPPSAFKIQFADALRPRGGVVPNLIKHDKNNDPYINFEAKPEALTLPAYGHDNDVFYPQRPYDKPSSAKHKFNKFNKNQPHSHYRKHPKSDHREGSSSAAGGGASGAGVVSGPSRGGSAPPEKK